MKSFFTSLISKVVTDEETRNSASANLERESTKSPLANTLAEFLKRINMQRYEKAFAENGYDHVDFIGRDLISRDDLVDMGVKKDDLKVLTEAVEENKIMQGEPKKLFPFAAVLYHLLGSFTAGRS